MPILSSFLSPVTINLNDILLDPNNPRFAELGQELDAVPESRFAEGRVQRDAFDRMKSPRFDVADLRDTIKNLGYLPMDRIVVRGWYGSKAGANKYVVVEGNRRIAGLKWLLELQDTGKETFTAEQLENLTVLPALLLDDKAAPDSARWTLPGLRHVSGIKEWGPYQKGRAVYVLRESGMSPQEAAQSLGLKTRGANQLWRSFLALEQMKADEEYNEYADPRLYSYFEEVFKRANVRDSLEWNDNDRRFTNEERIHEFYGWMVGEPTDEGELGDRKLPEAKSVRDLGTIIDDPKSMAVFRAPGGGLTKALAKHEAEHREDWHPALTDAETILASLSPDILRGLTPQDMEALEALRNRIDRVLDDRKRLLGDKRG